MVSALHRVCDLVEAAFKLMGVILFTVMIIVVFYEIVMRYIFGAPTFWAEPLARNAMIWMVLLGLAIGIRQKENICVDFLADRIAGPARPVIAVIRFLLVLAFAGVMVFYGAKMAMVNMRQTITGLNIPTGWVQVVVPIAATGMILFIVELFARRDWDRF